jgi:N-succinyldiaminopimelate aminotransferase
MINPRLEALSDYPFARLAALIQSVTPPADLAPIVLSVGEPQTPMPAFAREIIANEVAGWSKYPPNQGAADLCAAAAGWLERRYRIPAGVLDPARHVLPTAGSKEGVYVIGTVAVPPQKAGQQPAVMIPNPFYQVYLGAARLTGAEPVFVDAHAGNGFLPDYHLIDEATWKRTALVYFCSPANPQGAMASLPYLQRLIELCRRHDAVLAIDECYAEIYNAAPPPGGLEACLAMDETGGRDPFRNVAVFHSLSKRSSAAGMRSGFVAGDPRIVQMMVRWKTYGGTQIPLAIQAASAALWREEPHAVATREFYRRNFAVAQQILHNRFRYFTPDGGFFLWLDVGDGEAATRKLWQEGHVKVLPGGYLANGNGKDNPARSYIRVALVHDEATTREAIGRIARVL